MQGGRFVPAAHGNMRWNHNSVYYHELVADAAERGGSALDVGCGDGELLELLAGVCERVVGVEEDPVAARAAADRVAGSGTAGALHEERAEGQELGEAPVDRLVAQRHLEAALAQMAELLRPGGRLLVIGLSANKSLVDWLLSALMIVPGRVSGWIHRESAFPGMRVAWPRESLGEIRSVASILLPGARIRRRLYWRYSLMWTKPAA